MYHKNRFSDFFPGLCCPVGRLLYWDIDYREPVLCMQDPSRTTLRCCSVSPSGAFLAFAGDDELLKVVDLRSGQVTYQATRLDQTRPD